MAKQRPNDEGITYMPGEISTPQEGYRELANCIVAQAADDYVTYILKPNFEEEVDAVCEAAKEAIAAYSVLNKVRGDANYINALKGLYAEVTDRAKTNVQRYKKKIAVIEKQIAEAKDFEELQAAALRYRRYMTDLKYFMNMNDLQRRKMGKECEEFFRSQMFELFTSCTIDPDRLIEKCHEEADKIRAARGLKANDSVDRVTQ